MLGDSQIGKTSLMVKYVEGHFDEDYIQTLGSWRSSFHFVPCSSNFSFHPLHLDVCFLPISHFPLHGLVCGLDPDPLIYCCGCLPTLCPGVNFMEKTISVRRTSITFSLWDLGGQREFVNMLPLVCNDAVAILFMFDLSRKSTLNSVKEWYRQARGFNKVSVPLLSATMHVCSSVFGANGPVVMLGDIRVSATEPLDPPPIPEFGHWV